jgi:glyoxylase-like metal-dependent hydrolase (beta-lactamase superfamily II)
MRLTADVALVGGGPFTGFGVSSDADSHIYLLDGGTEAALIDCGLGTAMGVDRVEGNIDDAGVEAARIRRLFLTHYHADHAGGAAAYRERLHVQVSCDPAAASALENGDHDATQFTNAAALGFFPADYRFRACQIDDPVSDGASRTVGRLTVTAVATPGHCWGHSAYHVTGGERNYLFSGDAIFANGRILLQAIPDCDLGASLRSIRRLHDLTFDALLPGHGALALTGGKDHVSAAVATIDRLGVPANLV